MHGRSIHRLFINRRAVQKICRQPAAGVEWEQWKKFGGLMAVVGSAASLSYPPESFPEGKVALGGESVSA